LIDQLSLPLNDEIGMEIEPFRQLGERLISLDRGYRHFGFERR